MSRLKCFLVWACFAVPGFAISPGNYEKSMVVDGVKREFRLHIPKCFNGEDKLPVVLVFHGLSASAKLIQRLAELDGMADRCGFITVYPNGTGMGLARGFKAGNSERSEQKKPDDVRFVHCILNYLERCACSDCSRVYATGLSNGAMMCYRLAAEMPHRIAAIAPIGGALGTECRCPSCPISVMHFHGTCDGVLPFHGPREALLFEQSYYSVPRTIRIFARAAACEETKQVESLPDRCQDGTRVCLESYKNSDTGIEVVLVRIIGGGHQWPQKPVNLRYLGTASMEINANEMMWCFFQKHTVGCCCPNKECN